MGDEHELHAARHLAHDFAEAADVVLVERRVHFVEQAERRRIQFEDREDERHGGERLLAARQHADRAVPLAGRARHDGHARLEHVLADELEVRHAAAEQARELLLQAGVDPIERFLEAAARLAVDLADRFLERGQRVRQVGELAVEVFLALGLFLEFIDGREVDLAEPLDLLARLGEALLPGGDVRLRHETRSDVRQLEARRRELLEQRLAAQAQLLNRELHVLEQVAGVLDRSLRGEALLVEVPQAGIDLLEGSPRRAELFLDDDALLQRPLESLLGLRFVRLACGELRVEVGAARLEVRDLAVEAGEAREQRCVPGAA